MLAGGCLVLAIQVVVWLICFSTNDMNLTKWGQLQDYESGSAYNTKGIGFFEVFVTGVLMFIGVENMAMSSEETVDPGHQMPKGMIIGVVVTVVMEVVTALCCTASPKGLPDFLEEALPILSILKYKFGDQAGQYVTGVLGIIAAFFGVYANAHAVGRIIYALARGGEYMLSLC